MTLTLDKTPVPLAASVLAALEADADAGNVGLTWEDAQNERAALLSGRP